ncbi:hypothetical protein PTT_12320 [Pyrenophora teres f. teres 0-1]|uniref:Uncharacterized protein n=1 Tax=Pyrenophora teres f. teres (strain 0-1) TaxID=861557 RepID=E3RTI6_PYRTT|nr:hypothetical protein PTT_12320 [Pyrenophora teres f. teres 0-1]
MAFLSFCSLQDARWRYGGYAWPAHGRGDTPGGALDRVCTSYHAYSMMRARAGTGTGTGIGTSCRGYSTFGRVTARAPARPQQTRCIRHGNTSGPAARNWELLGKQRQSSRS